MNNQKEVINVMEASNQSKDPCTNTNEHNPNTKIISTNNNFHQPKSNENELNNNMNNNMNNISNKRSSITKRNLSLLNTTTTLNKQTSDRTSVLKISQIIANENLENIDQFDYIVKIILVGESTVGKTNLCKRYAKNEFDPNSLSTVSFELIEKIVSIGNERVKACIWDTIGQERFSSISNQYYRATNGALFIFDLSNRESFEKINKWIENYNNYAEKCTIVKFLVGNKSDLKNIKVTKEEILLKSKAYEFDGYFETSALNGTNVNEMFQKLVQCK